MNHYLVMQRRLTLTLIRREPTLISLTRAGQMVPNGTGGRVRSGEDTNRPARVRFFSAITGPSRFAQTTDGRRVEGDHVLIGEWDDDIQSGDEFFARGSSFKVIWVEDDRRYQTKAVVKRVTGGNG